VQPVGQLDEDHAQVIVGHRDQQLAQALHILEVAHLRVIVLDTFLHPLEVRHALHEDQHLVPKRRLDLFAGDVAVFKHVMQQAGGYHRRLEGELCKNVGHIQGMDEIGLIRLPGLPRVGPLGHRVGALNQVARLDRRDTTRKLLEDFLELDPHRWFPPP